MNSKSLLIALALLITSPMSFAASILDLPNNVEVKMLNGKTYDGDDDIALTEGTNQIVFRYVVNYRDSGMQTQFNSNAVVLTFDANNDQYELELPSIRNKNAANKFNKQPAMTLTNSQDKSVSFKSDVLVKEGLQIGRDYPEEMAIYNQSQLAASVTAFAPVVTAPIAATPVIATTQATLVTETQVAPIPAVVVKPKTIAEDQAEISEMLDYWYNKANQDTKAKFKAKINQ
ncbi:MULTISPECIES: DUF2057 domain-containing protein [Shewanella]|uniref:DUF2057 domain-containing protein n=1 Tax=Shewanella TaxID=22 RepID=UPI001BC34A72|nr:MULTISPECIES: DUF2057 domain-containing protein [Shewanella]GIU53888.1 UPF0319 protein [Shewanella sp. KT0246]